MTISETLIQFTGNFTKLGYTQWKKSRKTIYRTIRQEVISNLIFEGSLVRKVLVVEIFPNSINIFPVKEKSFTTHKLRNPLKQDSRIFAHGV